MQARASAATCPPRRSPSAKRGFKYVTAIGAVILAAGLVGQDYYDDRLNEENKKLNRHASLSDLPTSDELFSDLGHLEELQCDIELAQEPSITDETSASSNGEIKSASELETNASVLGAI